MRVGLSLWFEVGGVGGSGGEGRGGKETSEHYVEEPHTH